MGIFKEIGAHFYNNEKNCAVFQYIEFASRQKLSLLETKDNFEKMFKSGYFNSRMNVFLRVK